MFGSPRAGSAAAVSAVAVARERRGGFETAPSGAVPAGRPSMSSPADELTGPPAPFRDLTRSVGVLADVDPDDLPATQIAGCLELLGRAAAALAAIETRLIAAATAAGVPAQHGATSTADWLRRTLHVSGRQAKRRADLAESLPELESTARALAAGEITVEHAEHIARAARKGALGPPGETEAQLLAAANALDADRLRTEIVRREHAADADRLLRDEVLAYSRRRAAMTRLDDGMWLLRAELDPVNGEMVRTALDAMSTPDPADQPIELRRRPEQRAADALVAVAKAALEAGAPPVTGKAAPHVTVVVPWETLVARSRARAGAPVVDGADAAARTGEAAWSGPLSPDAIRRLACDAGIARLVVKGRTQILEAGREERSWSGAQRRAIVARDGHCRFGACDRPAAWCVIHHVRFWTDGGTTDVGNGVLLCEHHHHRVHEGGWSLAFDRRTGTVTVTSRDGRRRLVSEASGVASKSPPRARAPD